MSIEDLCSDMNANMVTKTLNTSLTDDEIQDNNSCESVENNCEPTNIEHELQNSNYELIIFLLQQLLNMIQINQIRQKEKLYEEVLFPLNSLITIKRSF
jgi:hypothetical protein